MKEKLLNLMCEYEVYSESRIEPVDGFIKINSDNRWQANSVEDFEDDKITKFYIGNEAERVSRWELWSDIIELFKKHKITSNLDIGCANNHFSFLCNSNSIFSLGIDPRKSCLKSSEKVFKKHFGDDIIKYGYIGNIKTFINFFAFYTDFLCNDQVPFECVSILNFLHGIDAGKKFTSKACSQNEIEQLFKLLPKISKYTILSEPDWDKLNLPNMTKEYQIIDSISKNSKLIYGGPIVHNFYKLRD